MLNKNIASSINPSNLNSKVGLMVAANKAKWDKWHLECQKEAILEFPILKNNPLFISGIMLYWGEGDKVVKNGLVRLSNTDPKIIKIFYLFLSKIALIPKEKIFIKLIIYPDINDIKCKSFWKKYLNISSSQIKNTVVIKGKHPTKRLPYGVCSIEVSSRKLKEKVITWIDLSNEFLGGKL